MFTTKRNNVLADGGMMQEGGTVDEISGNDVPIGSTKEEVRDDIDAKLSVGEYVFPADVTRYYGIAKLEAMRREAQEGLKKMESGGRMGNAEQVSEEAANEYDDAKFSKEVDEDMEAYDEEQGYAEGGVVTYDPVASKETYKRAPLKGFEMIPMSDDKGNTIYIPFINGKPQLNIPPGFAIRAATPKAETPVTDSTTPTAPAADQRGGGGGNQGRGLGYSPTSALSAPGPVSLQGNIALGLGAYGEALGGLLPGAAMANLASKVITPTAAAAEDKAVQSLISQNISAFGPSYAGANYGTSVADGGYGVTSMTGAGIAANPMGIDPATAQGQQAMKNIISESMQLSIDKNIDPNDALNSVMSGIVVGPAITTPNITTTNLNAVADQSAAESARLAAAQTSAASQSGSQRGGESVGGYGAGSQAGKAAAAGTVGGYGPGTPGFGGGGGGGGGSAAGAGGSPGSKGTGSGVGSGGVGPTCFVKGVMVTLSDGRRLPIEDVEVGDIVLSQSGSNKVIAHDRPSLIIPEVREGTLYGFNGNAKFITSEHPVMTKDGWKAIDQDKAKKFEPHLSKVLIDNLTVGDELLMIDGTYTTLDSIDVYVDQPQQQLYNLMLDGDHTYYVNNMLVHNKGGDSSGG